VVTPSGTVLGEELPSIRTSIDWPS